MFVELQLPVLQGILDKLSADTPANWGLMSAQHMVEHLIQITSMSSNKIPEITIITPEDKLPRRLEFLMSDLPMPRDFKAPTLPPDTTLPLQYPDLATAKGQFFKELNDFFAYFKEHPSSTLPHPVFGNLTFEQWKMLHRKHFTHHFLQFGLVSE